MTREIVFDTETTGLDPNNGDRLVEIGCVELINRFPSGKTFHVYINPERKMSEDAFKVHGLSTEFLSDKPTFAVIAEEFLDFIGNSTLVAHNANFDVGFINAELARLKRPTIGEDRVIDTLLLARRKHPAGPNSLDALCARYHIDNTHRTLHGALLDAQLLTEVYVELLGGRQAELGLSEEKSQKSQQQTVSKQPASARPNVLAPRLDDKAHKAHLDFIKNFTTNPIWARYLALK